MGADQDSTDVCIECSRLEDGRILLQIDEDWILTLTPKAGRVMAGVLQDVAGGIQYACSVFTTDEATLLVS